MMDQRDEWALMAAIATMRADLERRELIENMLRTEPWAQVGRFAAGCCQVQRLNLKGWECPPCDTNDVAEPSDCYGHRPNEVLLLQRMLRAGVSRFDPDPMPAIERIERERAG